MKPKRAFSLIELSIVILIIGIIVAGVTQSSSLVRKMKLATARSLTKSSPVSGVSDLALWLEATSEESLSNSLNNLDKVAQWNDINPQETNKGKFIQSTDANKPLYLENGINGLPALQCDGSNDFMSITAGSSTYLNAGSPSVSDNFAVFFVALTTATHEVDTESNSSAGGTSGQKYLFGATHGMLYGVNSAGMGISLGTNGVSVYEHTDGYMPPIAVYNGSNGLSSAAIIGVDYKNKTPTIFINGTSVRTGLTSSKTVFPSSIICYDGAYGAFAGNVGEIIIYRKSLMNEERKAVEKYLGQKWGIKTS